MVSGTVTEVIVAEGIDVVVVDVAVAGGAKPACRTVDLAYVLV
jgi:L-alanine-DL-glutamate epimerase-like enolase superfamily enzyme